MTTNSAMPDEVYVRMYRALQPLDTREPVYGGLLGDCFLIRLIGKGVQSTILIDCGILTGSAEATERMKAIARDIVETCNGRLDLLVVTHEHWDHLSGFSHAQEILLGQEAEAKGAGAAAEADGRTSERWLSVGKIWMAWTENPDDPQGQAPALRQRFDRTGSTLAAVAERAGKDRQRMNLKDGQSIEDLAAFLGPLGESESRGDAKLGLASAPFRRLQTREILDRLRQIATPEYLEPGQVIDTPGAVSVRAFVLGPPRNEERLFKDRPSADPDKRETYFDMLMLDAATVHGYAHQDPLASPFGPRYCRLKSDGANGFSAPQLEGRETWPESQRDTVRWLRERYFGISGDSARNEAQRRRRIDLDWLSAAGSLALKLDSDTNNTSLVLAFEYGDGDARPIMLFAADAQVGNWLSWHDQAYEADGQKVTAENLLNRTRFYKVGHHGSHNATLAEKGLKMMTDPELVAAIPTDEALGKRQGRKGWRMPDPGVHAALMTQTRGRILRNDRLYWPKNPEKRTDPVLEGVDPAFFKRITEEALYLEYQLLPKEPA